MRRGFTSAFFSSCLGQQTVQQGACVSCVVAIVAVWTHKVVQHIVVSSFLAIEAGIGVPPAHRFHALAFPKTLTSVEVTEVARERRLDPFAFFSLVFVKPKKQR